MADNYLENQYESYLARKTAMGKKTAKKKPIVKVQRLQSEAIEALKDIIAQPSFRMPFDGKAPVFRHRTPSLKRPRFRS